MRRTRPLGARVTSLALAVAVALSLTTARAADAPPPAPPTAPAMVAPPGDPEPTPPPAVLPAAPPPGAALEAGDTAPPGAVAPVATVDPRLAPVPPAPRPQPFYQKSWFWGALAVALITFAIIGSVNLQPVDPAQPQTRLGDMRAF